jgi:lysine 6-dehydrogenase
MGTAPGMSNIMGAYGVQQLDTPESIEIKDACVDMAPDTEHSHPLYWGYAIEGIIEEFVMEHPYFVDGEMTSVPARSYPEWIDFRPPAGKVMVATTPHTENVSLPQTFKTLGLKHASWKIGFEVDFEEKMTFLRDLGLFKIEPVEVDGVQVSPRALMLKLLHNQPPETKKAPDFRGHMIVIVKGEQGGQKIEYTITEFASGDLTAKMREKGVFSSYRTGIYGAIAALMIARGKIEKKGVFYPEACVPPDLFLKEAAKVGIEVDVSRRVWL